jgi:hypothetical protein
MAMHNVQSYKPSYLEQFGIYFLQQFNGTKHATRHLSSDKTLAKKTNKIFIWSIVISSIISVVFVYPIVKVDLLLNNESFLKHYGTVTLVTIFLTIIEVFLLFMIALYVVHQLSKMIPINEKKSYLQVGPFRLINILSRTALEINEPEVEFFGINPFKQLSKKNLLMLSLLYKLKILLTNLIIKWTLILLIGETILNVSVLYEAVFVEIFWNAIIIYNITKEARLRIFGFFVANTITEKPETIQILNQLSNAAKEGCLRAIANTVVMTKNYHPNMMILLFEFLEQLNINTSNDLDDWKKFIAILHTLPDEEKNIVFDVLCIAIAFDGKLSNLEIQNIQDAFGIYANEYTVRIQLLIQQLRQGKVNQVLNNCLIDKVVG